MSIRKFTLATLAMVALSAPVHAAPMFLDGMGMQKQWTDNENVTNEMPGFVWGNSDVAAANNIGLYMEFADGTTASISLSGVAPHWNTNGGAFAGVSIISASGFFTAYGSDVHFLYNTAATTTFPQALPIAWIANPATPYGNNVELDYNDQSNGSQARFSTTGWQSVEITTYSSSAVVPEPATLGLFGLGLVGLGLAARRRKTA